jgi:hypothetical protein
MIYESFYLFTVQNVTYKDSCLELLSLGQLTFLISKLPVDQVTVLLLGLGVRGSVEENEEGQPFLGELLGIFKRDFTHHGDAERLQELAQCRHGEITRVWSVLVVVEELHAGCRHSAVGSETKRY